MKKKPIILIVLLLLFLILISFRFCSVGFRDPEPEGSIELVNNSNETIYWRFSDYPNQFRKENVTYDSINNDTTIFIACPDVTWEAFFRKSKTNKKYICFEKKSELNRSKLNHSFELSIYTLNINNWVVNFDSISSNDNSH